MRFTTICLIPFPRQLEAFSSIVVQSLFLSQAVQTIGSTAEHSDVDIVLEPRYPDMFHWIGIKQDLEEQLKLPVDIVRSREKINAFLEEIGVKIQVSDLYILHKSQSC